MTMATQLSGVRSSVEHQYGNLLNGIVNSEKREEKQKRLDCLPAVVSHMPSSS